MTDTMTIRQGALPKDMHILLRAYPPRDAWPDHPNFARSIQQWMGAHDMFRPFESSDALKENGRLLRENRVLKEERDVLKKPQPSSRGKRREVRIYRSVRW